MIESLTSNGTLSADPYPGMVRPLRVYAARRQTFDVFVGGWKTPDEALDAVFSTLPMREHGWDRATAKATLTGKEPGGLIFRVERGQ